MVTPALVWPGLDLRAATLPRRVRRRLARARRSGIEAADSLALVCAVLGIRTLPAAPLARLADGGEADARPWFFAEPVTLVADRDRLALLPLEDPLGESESEALAAAVRSHFREDGLVLERRAGGRWYLFHPAVADVRTPPPAAAAEVSADPAAFGGADARALARILNEVQMLWHSHPVNETRRAEGRAAASGLWVWGGGVLPEIPESASGPRLLGGAAEIAGLGGWLGLSHAPLAPPGGNGAEANCIAVIEPGDETRGAEWLAALARRRSGFSLLMRDAVLNVPARRAWLSIGR